MAESFHHGGEVGVRLWSTDGLGRFDYKCHFFLLCRAVVPKVIKQVSQVQGGRLLSRLDGMPPSPANLTNGFAFCRIHGWDKF